VDVPMQHRTAAVCESGAVLGAPPASVADLRTPGHDQSEVGEGGTRMENAACEVSDKGAGREQQSTAEGVTGDNQ